MAKKTHDTHITLGSNLDPEQLYNPGHVDGTNTRDDLADPAGERHDISKDAQESLKDYVSRVSAGDASHQSDRRHNKGNTYQIPPEPEGSPEGQKVRSPMYRAGIDSETAANDVKDSGKTLGTYMNTALGFNENQARYFEDLSNSTYGKWGAGVENPFVKDGHPIDKEKGKGSHALLGIEPVDATKKSIGDPSVYGDPGPTEVQQRISSVMLVNRFNSSDSTPFMEDHKKTAYGYTKQSKMGVYDPAAPDVKEKDLKMIGEDLLSRAVGHDIDPENTGIGGKYDMAILPSIEQLTGWNTMTMGTLRAMNTKGGQNIVPTDAGVRSSMLTGDGDVDGKKTYGQLNSEYEHFDGPLPLGMVVNTVIGLSALIISSAVIMGMAEGIGAMTSDKGDGKVPKNTPPLDLAYGRHALSRDRAGDFLSKMFNIHIPEQNFGSSMFFGILLFYGIPAVPSPSAATPGMPGTDWTDIMDAIGGIASAPGFYSVVTRNVSRDTQQIEKAISDMGTDLGLGGMITQVLKIIEALTTSSTWKFLMTMVKIGEKGLHSRRGHPTLQEDINELGPGAVNRHKKSREMIPGGTSDVGSKEPGRLAWAHSSMPKRYLYPASFARAQTRMRGAGIVPDADLDRYYNAAPLERMYQPAWGIIPSNDTEGHGDMGHGEKFEGSPAWTRGRLPKEYVNWIEQQLDSEFMPFYFHDLRTNEIMSFHAFMTELSDGFSADYSSMSAYGRADDIMIYNKTTRSISFGFVVAATSQEDMQQMYWDINKLISMIYPQYSRGRTMIQGEGDLATKFVQPFSQIPTASPMIRVRFGDILKSNYSKFGIMRLFGLGETEDAFTLDKGEVDPADLADYARDLAAATEKAKKLAALRAIDPGGSDSAQNAGLTATLGPDHGHDVGGGDSEFGYREGDLVYLRAAPTRYWVRNNEGQMAKDVDDYPSDGAGKRLHKYPANVEVEVVKRVPDGASTTSQSPDNFGAHASAALPSEAPAGVDSPETIEADKPGTYFRRMAYMVKVKEGSAAATSLGSKFTDGPSMHYHRALHTEIAGLTPAGVKLIKDKELEGLSTPGRAAADGHELRRFFAGSEKTGAEPGKENYLIRSFESAMGKGLAGFITDLSFDWAESTWETEPGMRAPQMMKVSVSFAPIHDIPMGLDSDGMMRSVAYNVGDASGMVGHDPLGPDSEFEAMERAKAARRAATRDAGTRTTPAEEAAAAGMPGPPGLPFE